MTSSMYLSIEVSQTDQEMIDRLKRHYGFRKDTKLIHFVLRRAVAELEDFELGDKKK